MYLIAGGTGLLVFLLPTPPAVKDSCLVVYSLTSALAIFIGIVLNKPYPTQAWMIFGSGQALTAVGDVLILWMIRFLPQDLVVNISSWMYIVAIGCFLLGLGMILFAYRRLIKRDSLIDGMITASILSVMVWVFQVHPVLASGPQNFDLLRGVVFPGGSILILLAGSIFLMTSVGNSQSYHLLFICVLLNTVGLAFYAQMSDAPGFLFEPTRQGVEIFYNLNYASFYLCMGAALLHPSITAFHSLTTKETRPDYLMKVMVLGSMFFLLPFTFWLQYMLGRQMGVFFTLGSISILFAVLLVRIITLLEGLVEELNLERRKANNDELTGLPNRAFLNQYLPVLIGRAERNGSTGALFMMDLDHFKDVNDSFGHDKGDQVLRVLAKQFLALQPRGSLVARYGGDEFVFVTEHVGDRDAALAFAQRLSNEVHTTIALNGVEVRVTVSVGTALFPYDGRDMETIIKKADVALYQAKRRNQLKAAFDLPVAELTRN
jgi:diguanylate cyclase (GGDEF)-like protein